MSHAVPREFDCPVRAYIEAKLSTEDDIVQIRDDLYEKTVGAMNTYRKSTPHITIIPPFTIDKTKAHRVDELIEDSGLVGREIQIDGAGVWPSLENPRVVLLDTPVEIEAERQTLLGGLRDLGAVEIEEPVRPHITLFKSDNGYPVDAHVKRALQREIGALRETRMTKIEYVDFTVVSSLSSDPD